MSYTFILPSPVFFNHKITTILAGMSFCSLIQTNISYYWLPFLCKYFSDIAQVYPPPHTGGDRTRRLTSSLCCSQLPPHSGDLQTNLKYDTVVPLYTLHCNVVTTDAQQQIMTQTVTLADCKMRKRLFHLSSQHYDKLEEIRHWSRHGRWHTLNCRATTATSLSKYQLCSFLPEFSSPVTEARINDTLQCYCVIDSGCNYILASSGYLNFLIPDHVLTKYEGPLFRQADSTPLHIQGVFNCTFSIGTLTSDESIIIFDSPPTHREILVGFSYIQKHNIAICRSGLYLFPPSVFSPPEKVCETSDRPAVRAAAAGPHCTATPPCPPLPPLASPGKAACPAKVNNPKAALPTDDFPVLCTQEYTILPGAQQLILCRVISGDLTEGGGEPSYSVCHSEMVEPWVPLLDLSIYFQVVSISRIKSPFSLLYCNYTKQSIFLDINQVVAHCSLMRSAGDDDHAHLSKINPPASLACRILCPHLGESSLCSPNVSHMELKMECENDFNLSEADIQATDGKDVERLKSLLLKYSHIFASHAWSIGNIGSSFHMEPKTGVEPIQSPIVPVPQKIKNQAISIINRLRDLGLVVDSKSPWNSSILFLIKKPPPPSPAPAQQNIPENRGPIPKTKNRGPIPISQIRICLDFRAVNSSLRQNWVSYEIPKIEQVFQNVQGMAYISILDVNQAFWSKRLRKGISQDLTAFTFLGRHMALSRLCQGSRPASFVFQECLARILHEAKLAPYDRLDPKGNQLGSVSNYLDDILVCSTTKEEHFHLLDRLFTAFSENKVKLKLKKCSFLVSKTAQILGYELNVQLQTLQPSKALLKNILSLSPPKNKKQVQKTLGYLNFFSNLLPDYANKMVPLYNLLTLNTPFTWGRDEQTSFDWALRQLALKPAVFLLNVNLPCYCIVDSAQGNSIGYALLQWNSQLNTFCPVKFQSKRLSIHQRAYSQAQCEALGMAVMASENYALLLHGDHFCFNDSRALGFIARFRFDNLTVHRYHLLISSLSLSFCWLPNTHALITLVDGLSRKKISPKSEIVQVLNKKLSREKIDNLKHLNFFGLPDFTYDEVMQLFDSFYKLCDKYTPSHIQNAADQLRMKVHFPPTPQISAKIKSQACNIYSSFKNNTIGTQPLLQYCVRHVSVPSPEKASQHDLPPPLGSLLQVENKLAFHFPSFSLKHLIAAQKLDTKLVSLSINFPDKFPLIRGVICKVMKQPALLSHVVCWPIALNLPLIAKTHTVDGIIHLGQDKLFSDLKQYLYIRNFQKSYKELDCSHCMLNYRQPKVPRPLGLTFKVTSPRTFLAFDIATIRSDWKMGSFFLICDVVTNFIMATPCLQCPTAEQAYEIIFTKWIAVMGYPSAYTSDNGGQMSNQLSADISHLLNIRHFLISPTHSNSNKSELFNKFLISILAVTNQKGMLSERTFPLVLSLSTLLWNSSRSKYGASPSQLQFFTSNTRTHQFQTFSNLLHQQTRSAFSQHVLFVSTVLSLISKKRKELNLRKKQEWEQHSEKIKKGSYVFIERDRRPGPGHKLRALYKSILHVVIVQKPTYCLLLPLQSSMELFKNPFVAGTKTKRRLLRVPLTKLKLCQNPLKYLNLSKCQKYLDAAAEVLGQVEPVREVILGGPLPSRAISHPFARFWSSPKQVANRSLRPGTPTVSVYAPNHSPPFIDDSHQHWKNVDQFIRAVGEGGFPSNFPFQVLHTPHHWVYIKSGLDSNVTSPTCSYQYESMYFRNRKKCQANRQLYLKDVEHSGSGGLRSPPPLGGRGGQIPNVPSPSCRSHKTQNMLHHKFARQFKFFNDLSKRQHKKFSVFEKKRVFPTILSFFQSSSDDDDEEDEEYQRARLGASLSHSNPASPPTSSHSQSHPSRDMSEYGSHDNDISRRQSDDSGNSYHSLGHDVDHDGQGSDQRQSGSHSGSGSDLTPELPAISRRRRSSRIKIPVSHHEILHKSSASRPTFTAQKGKNARKPVKLSTRGQVGASLKAGGGRSELTRRSPSHELSADGQPLHSPPPAPVSQQPGTRPQIQLSTVGRLPKSKQITDLK